jgi:ABC-2 type transport system ATP-binding protein
VDNGPKVAVEVLRVLDDAGITLAGLALREPSLDDVFLSLTGHKTDEDAPAPSSARPSDSQGAKGKKKNKGRHRVGAAGGRDTA